VDKPLRILAVVNTPWDPRLGAARVWIELAEEWTKAGHTVEKYCLADAFPTPASSPRILVLRQTLFPFCVAKFVRHRADHFDVIDALAGTITASKKSLRFSGLLVMRSVGLHHLYDRFERRAVRRWPAPRKGRLLGRIYYGLFYKRVGAATRASIRHCDLLNLPNSDELLFLRDEAGSARPAIVQPYGLTNENREALAQAAASSEKRWRKKTVCFIGMWTLRKGAKDWRRIITLVRERVPEARFLFLGTMAEEAAVLSDLEADARKCIELVARFQPHELPQLLSECAVGAFPSYVEGFGLAVVEQLAAGIPVVTYDVSGPRDILRDDFPELLVALGDVQKFSETIIDILTNDFPRYEQLRRRSVAAAAKFSWPSIARATIQEYRRQLAALPRPHRP